MCVRYTLTKGRLSDVAEALGAETSLGDEGLYKPSFNAAPTDVGWAVSYQTDRRILHAARWNYLIGAKRRLVNIRSESTEFSRFRDVFASNRCAVVTDGYFAWPEDDLNPVWIHPPDGALLLLGGLLQQPQVASARPRFSVLTTRSNALVKRFHDRMPVVIAMSQLEAWLTAAPQAAREMLEPAPKRGLVATRVSEYVNDVKHDDPGCLAPPSYEP